MCMYVYIIHAFAWPSTAGQQMHLLPKWAENASPVMLQLIQQILQQESLKLYITLSPFHGSLFLLDQARYCGFHVIHASLGLSSIA